MTAATFVPLDQTVRHLGVAFAIITGFALVWPLNKAMIMKSQRLTVFIGSGMVYALIAAVSMLHGGDAQRASALSATFGFTLTACVCLVLSVKLRFFKEKDKVRAKHFFLGCSAALMLGCATAGTYAGAGSTGNALSFAFESLFWVTLFLGLVVLSELTSLPQRAEIAFERVTIPRVRQPKVERSGAASSRKRVKKGNRHNRSRSKAKKH